MYTTILPQLLSSAIILIIIILLRLVLIKLVRRFASSIERVEHRTGLIVRYVDFLCVFLTILASILIWGVQFEDLGWVMSSVFAVIGVGFFATWSILSNITSGIIMFFTFPFKIGDYIRIHDKEHPYEGYIDNIKAFQVILRSQNGEITTYPNAMLMQKGVSIINFEQISTQEKQLDDKKDQMF